MADETTTPPAPTKPGYKTTEFYLASAAKLLGLLFASGLIGSGTLAERIAGLAAMVLAMLGYTVSRTLVKAAGVLLLITALSAPQLACGALKGEGKAIAADVVDCTTKNARTLTDQFAPLVDEVLRNATGGDGKIDWAPVKVATKTFAIGTGGCVFANVVARAMKPKPVDPAAPQASNLEVDRTALLDGFRALYPGKRFLTTLGEL